MTACIRRTGSLPEKAAKMLFYSPPHPLPYSISPLSAEVAVRSDVPHARTALRNGCGEALLLPGVLLGDIFDARKAELRGSVLQVFAAQKVDGGAGVGVDEGRMVRDTVGVISEVVEGVLGGPVLHGRQ